MAAIIKDAIAGLVSRVWPRYRYIQLIDEISALAFKCDVEDNHFDVMQKILELSEDDVHYVQLVLTMVTHITEANYTGALSIGYLLDVMALPSPEIALQLINKLYDKISGIQRTPIGKALIPLRYYRVRNIFTVIGILAEKLAGRTAEQMFSEKLMELLLLVLGEDGFPIDCRLGALLVLEKFSKTGTNKERLRRTVLVNLLQKFQKWDPVETSIALISVPQSKSIIFPIFHTEAAALTYLQSRVEEMQFVASWLLDNSFLTLEKSKFNFDHIEVWKRTNAFMSRSDGTSYIKISPDGLTIRNDNTTFESIRANIAADKVGCWYYEVELITNGMMQIGWATNKTNFESDDGQGVGDTLESFAYDGFRMQLWLNSEPISFGPKCQWKSRDVLSSLINLKTGSIMFAINGKRYYEAPFYLSEFFLNTCLYPAASLTHHQQVRFNFGREPFRFAPPDLQDMLTFNSQALPTNEPFPDYHRANLWPRPLLASGGGDSSNASSAHSSCVSSPAASSSNLPSMRSSAHMNRRRKKCMICFSKTADTQLSPCLHDGLCFECALRLETCPLCRQAIDMREQQQQPLYSTATPGEQGIYKRTGSSNQASLSQTPSNQSLVNSSESGVNELLRSSPVTSSKDQQGGAKENARLPENFAGITGGLPQQSASGPPDGGPL